jgi:hypothetical protein
MLMQAVFPTLLKGDARQQLHTRRTPLKIHFPIAFSGVGIDIVKQDEIEPRANPNRDNSQPR